MFLTSLLLLAVSAIIIILYLYFPFNLDLKYLEVLRDGEKWDIYGMRNVLNSPDEPADINTNLSILIERGFVQKLETYGGRGIDEFRITPKGREYLKRISIQQMETSGDPHTLVG